MAIIGVQIAMATETAYMGGLGIIYARSHMALSGRSRESGPYVRESSFIARLTKPPVVSGHPPTLTAMACLECSWSSRSFSCPGSQ